MKVYINLDERSNLNDERSVFLKVLQLNLLLKVMMAKERILQATLNVQKEFKLKVILTLIA